ncbi:PH domain-containing protein [Flagellimonas sp. S3867]|uniref:PH domain-containing protein n=1 Tax=Flagellimonas sp. S3867 TaxID=2768063 RepID=UPI0016886457|nr:PH domain-containing protein [Flagellimonas sp. S3867]
MKRYPSKISYGLLLFVLAVIIGTTIPIISQGNLLGLGINLFTLIFVLYVFFSIYYVIEGNNLVIRVGVLFKWKIEISTIKIVAKSNSWISSPAASLDRLNIIYNKHSSILVSPKDKEGFIKELIRINPQIEEL